MRRTLHEAFLLAEQRIVAGEGVGAEGRGCGVVSRRVALPLGPGAGIGAIVDAVLLEHPGALDPGNVLVFVGFAEMLEPVRGVVAEQVRGRGDEARQVVLVQLHPVDARAAASGPEQVRRAVVIHKEHRVERHLPPEFRAAGVLEGAQVVEGTQGGIRFPDGDVVPGQIVLPPVFVDVGGGDDARYIVVLPVQEVFGHPGAAAGAVHIVGSVIVQEDGDVSGSDAVFADGHGKRIAVTLGAGRRAEEERGQGKEQESIFHMVESFDKTEGAAGSAAPS